MKVNSSSNTTHATATTTVDIYKPTPVDQPGEGAAIIQVHLEERFEGDIRGKGVAEVLQATGPDGAINFVTIERVTGEVAQTKGTFLLQVSGTVAGKAMKAEWFVVPRSGTAALAGLRGTGGFVATLGEHGSATLDYWFE